MRKSIYLFSKTIMGFCYLQLYMIPSDSCVCIELFDIDMFVEFVHTQTHTFKGTFSLN